MECEEVEEHLVDGALYTLMVKSGTDGQSGRGNFAWKDKTVSDNKWLVGCSPWGGKVKNCEYRETCPY